MLAMMRAESSLRARRSRGGSDTRGGYQECGPGDRTVAYEPGGTLVLHA